MAVALGIVVPCFNEAQVLEETCRRLLALRSRLVRAGKLSDATRICLVDDGSTDGTWRLIEGFCAAQLPVVGVKLARNRGHQNALLAGLFTAPGDAVVSIDADLQDDVEVIEKMVDAFVQGHDIVYGVRASRTADTWFKRFTAESFYNLLRAMGVATVFNHADYRLMSRRAVTELARYEEVNLYLRGIVPLLGFRSTTVEYDRVARFAGESKYPLRKMLGLAVDGITSSSIVPLRVVSALGFAVSVSTLFVSLWVLWVRLFTERAAPGWASTLLPIYLLGGIQILCLGMIGEYVGKTYSEAKRRPRYVIERVEVGLPSLNGGP